MKIYTEVVIDMTTMEIEKEQSYEYEGEIAQCHGGGVSFSNYIENYHKLMLGTGTGLDNSIAGLVNTALEEDSPYSDENAFDPRDPVDTHGDVDVKGASPFGRMDARFDATESILDALAPETDWENFVDKAAEKQDKFSSIDFLGDLETAITGLLNAVDTVLDKKAIENMVSAYETRKRSTFLRNVGVWSAGMADVNAVHTSSFIIGLALQQSEYQKDVDAYEAQLKGNIYNSLVSNSIQSYLKSEVLRVQNKDNMILQGSQMMGKLQEVKSTMLSELTRMKTEIERIQMTAMKESIDRDVQLDVENSLWDFEIYSYVGNIMSSVQGMPAGRKTNTSPTQGALGGAMTGASIGSAIPGVGTAIGAGAGAILGWATS